MTIQAVAATGHLSHDAVRQALEQALAERFARQKVLVLIPDHTRSLPLPLLFRMLVDVLHDAQQLDFMVALGTHPPLGEQELSKLVGVTAAERAALWPAVGLLNHAWDDPAALETLGVFEQDEIRALAGSCWHPSLPSRVPVRINRLAL